MEAQLKGMRVPELKELATKAGMNVAAKLTKDKIIALLLENPNVAAVLDGTGASAVPPTPSAESTQPAPSAPKPAKGSIADLLAPMSEPDSPAPSAPTIGVPPVSATESVHVAKPLEVNDSSAAASNAYGSTATSAAATSAPTATAGAASIEASSDGSRPAPASDAPAPINPLEGPSKPVAGAAQLTEEERRAARKARFEREWQLDQARKEAEAAAKGARADVNAKDAAAKKVAATAKQAAAAPVANNAQPDTKANGANGAGIPADLVEKRKARFAQAGGQGKESTSTTASMHSGAPATPLLTGPDAEKAAARRNKFNNLLPGQPGYEEVQGVEASPKRKREDDVEEPSAKKAKADGVTA